MSQSSVDFHPTHMDRALAPPLSSAQQRVWFVEQFESGSTGNQFTCAFRLRGELDERDLRQAVQAVVERHGTLRTRFVEVDGRPAQIVETDARIQLSQEDWSGYPKSAQAEKLTALLRSEWDQPFQPGFPMFRLKLVHLAVNEYIFVQTFHYLVSDQASLEIFFRELVQAYTAARQGRDPQWEALSLQYIDFVAWEQSYRKQDGLVQDLAYWKDQLAGLHPVTLPYDAERSRASTAAGVYHVTLPAEQFAILKQPEKMQKASTHAVVAAALAVLLAKLTDGRECLIACPVEIRHDPVFNPLMGCFLNLVPLRLGIEGWTQEFWTLVESVQKTIDEDSLHCRIPFEDLVAELSPDRRIDLAPPFPIELDVHGEECETCVINGLQVERLRVDKQRVAFDLEINVYERNGRLDFDWVYKRDLFDHERIADMAELYLRILQSAIADPHAPILKIVPAPTDTQIVAGAEIQAAGPELSVVELFEQQAASLPDATALVCGEEAVSYMEARQKVHELSLQLKRLGAGPEEIIGVCISRSVELVLACMAVLKTGSACLPIAPEIPFARKSEIINDARVTILLTTTPLEGPLPHPLRVVRIDEAMRRNAEAESESFSGQNADVIRGEQAAYAVYTSGSTGRPKGVVVSHGSLAHKIRTINQRLGIGPSTKYAVIAPIGVDPLFEQMLCPVCAGGQVTVVPEEVVEDRAAFLAYCGLHEISVVDVTPALAEHLFESTSDLGFEILIVGGDVLTTRVANGLQKSGAAKRLFNVYGPTETCIDATFHEIVGELKNAVPIGKPFPGYYTFVLDEQLRPVGMNVIGELYIAGVGVARGYLNHPSLTAERFVACPFASGGGQRMYRTGDLARWGEDFVLEFAGRADDQIKISGYRVEPEEVRAVLQELPGVKEALVIAYESSGHKQLAAYMIADRSDESFCRSVSDELRKRLPDYMVPSAVIPLQSWPLTLSGKIDRRALPQPGTRPAKPKRLPVTKKERELARIVAELLSLPAVGMDDNFFELGGHSLLAMKLISRIQSAFQSKISLRKIFECPTVAELATHLSDLPAASQLPLVPQARDGQLCLSFAQQRLWVINQMEKGNGQYNWLEGWRILGELNPDALKRALQAIIDRHESLRTQFPLHGDTPVQVIAPSLEVSLSTEDLSGAAESEKESRIKAIQIQQWNYPFDLANGPLLRLNLLKFEQDHHILLLTVHHIIWDGWSQSVFIQELGALYEAFEQERGSPLDPLPVQYADFAIWQRKWLDEGTLAAQSAYWRNHLAEMPLELALPRDHSRKQLQTFASEVCKIILPADSFRKLRHFGDSHAATPFMTLLAVLSIFFARYSGQDDIAIGSPIANRPDPKLEELIGFFVNSLVMRVQVSPKRTFRETVALVRTIALDAYLNQDLPFERLVEEVCVDRHLNRTPLFQVVFAMLDAVAPQQSGAVRFEHLPAYAQRVRFDLEIHAIQHPEHIEIEWIYNRSLFERWRVEQMSRHFINLLHDALAHPELPVEHLNFLDAQDQRLVLEEFSCRGAAAPAAVWPELFESQAKLTPDCLAVVASDGAVSYCKLNERANQLAHALMGWGAGPEQVVCIAMGSSLKRVEAIVAVLKAGAACLVVDRHIPALRLEYILKDCCASFVVIEGQDRARFSSERRIIDLDSPSVSRAVGSAAITNPTDRERHSSLLYSNLAYLIYTSGSTGIPKGVSVTHRGIAALAAQSGHLGITHQSRIAQFAAPTFDAFVWEMMMALFTGATLVLVPDDMRSGSALHDVLSSEQITHALLPPTVLGTLSNPAQAPLATLIVGGEACSMELVRQWSFGRRMVNAYGPTESTVCATLSSPLAEGEVVPLGRPIQGTAIYILDSNLKLSPVGVQGELYIAGEGLARGYLNQPGLTASRFVADPFGAPGARMYRSGDLARWRVDGTLEFLGRNDRQVKVRGVRIELAEIEAALMRDKRVLEAVATTSDTKLGRHLFAYVTERPGHELAQDFEEAHLQEWEELYDSTYAGEKVSLGDFNIVGWNSSYTSKPITSVEMQIWLAESVQRIRKLRPRRVAEIGCGTGLLLTRLAPECESYIGIDFSAKVLEQVGAYIAHRPEMDHVVLHQGFADRLEMIGDHSVDLTIINSVLQYFPSVEYLMKVLDEALRITADHGHIFVGDVRNAVLLEAFHTSVLLDKLPASTPLHELLQRVAEACNNEKELVVHPELFLQFGRHHERIGRVDVSLKAGAYDNELSRFRYDVVLHLGPRSALHPSEERLPWDAQGSWRSSVEKLLAKSSTASIALRGFPDARVAASVESARMLHSAPSGIFTLAQLKKSLEKVNGEDPNSVFELCKRLNVEVCWQGWNESGVYDVVINPQWRTSLESSLASACDYARYGNTPGRRQQRKKLGRILQQQLKQSLPDYMTPSVVMVLPSWPLTASGKIDMKALPAPETHIAVQRRSPGTPKEALLCSLVANILGRKSVDPDESFFALGGDSILSIQLVSQARSAGLIFTPGEVFQHPTVAALARIARENNNPCSARAAEASGPVAMTPIMRWMLEWSGVPRAFFQVQFLHTPARISLHELEMMLQALVDHHEGLRSRLVVEAGLHSGHLHALPPGSIEAASFLERVDVSSLDEHEHLAVAREQARAAGEKLDPEEGRMIHAVWLDAGSHRRGGLLLIIHHLVVDGVSWRILMSDLSLLWEAVSGGRRQALPDNKTSHYRWSQELYNRAKGEQAGDVSFWLRMLTGPDARLFKVPLDRCRDTVRNAGQCVTFLPAPLVSAMLTTVCNKFRAQMNDILVTALVLAIAKRRCHQGETPASVVLELEGHGREPLADDIDLSRAVGWFTITYPVEFELRDLSLQDAWSGGPALGKALKRVKETLRNTAKKGLDYGLLRYLNEQHTTAFASVPPPDVRFNYLGHFVAAEETDWSIRDDIELGEDPNMPMSHALMLDILTLERRNGCTVKCVWSWAPAVVSEPEVRDLCQSWTHILDAIVRHCMEPNSGGLTPSDVPLVSINQDEIEFLRKRVRQRLLAGQ